jgi:DNA-binding transcriptional regulator LsrR (DeoR family)
MPVTQTDVGDALGLSSVHVNRVLQDMRRDRLISWRGSSVTILKWEELQMSCAFDPTYLHQDQEVGAGA